MEELLRENEYLKERLKGHKELETMAWNFVGQCIKGKTKADQ